MKTPIPLLLPVAAAGLEAGGDTLVRGGLIVAAGLVITLWRA